MIYNLTDKTILLSAHEFQEKNLDLVKKLLINNDYPKKFVDSNIKKRLKKLQQNMESVNNTNSQRILKTVNIPFIPEFYNKMKQSLKYYGIRTVPKIVNTFNNIIVKGKDKQPRM